MAKATKSGGSKKAITKSAFVTHLADKTGLTKKQVDAVLNEVVELVKGQLGSKGPKKMVIPGLARLSVTQVKAVKGGVEKTNPLNGKTYVTKDRPAFNKVNIRPIKALKEALK